MGSGERYGLFEAFSLGGAVTSALSVTGLIAFFRVFFYYDTDFWFLLEREHSYTSFGETFFAVCLFVSLSNLLWLVPVLLFG